MRLHNPAGPAQHSRQLLSCRSSPHRRPGRNNKTRRGEPIPRLSAHRRFVAATYDLHGTSCASCCLLPMVVGFTARPAIVGSWMPRRHPQRKRLAVLSPTRAARRDRPSATGHLPQTHRRASPGPRSVRRATNRWGCGVGDQAGDCQGEHSGGSGSGTARRRTTAFRPPMASASNPTRVSRTAEPCAPAALAMTDATRTRPA